MQGIGNTSAVFNVCIGNTPPLKHYQNSQSLIAAKHNELASIVSETGNHWRKVFNIYAKLGFLLNTNNFATWQDYRDRFLLQEHSNQALLFTSQLSEVEGIIFNENNITLISGKAHAIQLLGIDYINRLTIKNDFPISIKDRLIVTPYFDYRQLSNKKLSVLIDLIESI